MNYAIRIATTLFLLTVTIIIQGEQKSYSQVIINEQLSDQHESLSKSGVDLIVFLDPNTISSEAIFTSRKNMTFNYEPESEVSNTFNGTNSEFTFTLRGDEQNFLSALNTAFSETNSPVRATDAILTYNVSYRGNEDKLMLEYVVQIHSIIERYVLEDKGPTLMDMDWRKINLKSLPLSFFDVPYKVDIVQSLALFQLLKSGGFFYFAEGLENSPPKSMTNSLFDFTELGTPISKWQESEMSLSEIKKLYPNVTIDDVKDITTYSLTLNGSSNNTTENVLLSGRLSGEPVSLQTSFPPSTSQIQIAGHSTIEKINDNEVVKVTEKAPEASLPSEFVIEIETKIKPVTMESTIPYDVVVKFYDNSSKRLCLVGDCTFENINPSLSLNNDGKSISLNIPQISFTDTSVREENSTKTFSISGDMEATRLTVDMKTDKRILEVEGKSSKDNFDYYNANGTFDLNEGNFTIELLG